MTRQKALLELGRRRNPPPLRAPYTFVPVGERLASPVGDGLNIGRPLEKAICGTLKVRWTAETPLLVGGVEDGDGKNVRPFRINGDYALPGASLKGMIRSVLEIAAFGRLTFFDDLVGYTRNMNGTRWHEAVRPEMQGGIDGRSGEKHPQKGGWLLRRWSGKVWEYRLVQADARIFEIDRIVAKLPDVANRASWHEMTAHARMTAMKAEGLIGMVDAGVLLPNAEGQGMIVVAGKTPAEGQNHATGKKTEALFLASGGLNKIATSIGDRFLKSLQRDSNEKRRGENYQPTTLYDALAVLGPTEFARQDNQGYDHEQTPEFEEQAKDLARFGLPVFWRVRGRTASQSSKPDEKPVLSLTALMRVPFENSLYDVAQRTQPGSDDDPLDLVQALFGWAPPDGDQKELAIRKPQERSLRSRVRFGFARAEGGEWPTVTKKMIGAKPSASFWPYYLRPNKDSQHPVDYDNPHAVLAGRKRYPARHVGEGGYDRALPTDGTDSMHSDLTFLEAGIAFDGEIRVRNLHPIEAGALLWAIRMGQRGCDGGPLRHMLGRAKAFGYGQMRAEIVSSTLKDELGGTALDEDTAMSEFESWVAAGLGVERFDMLEPVRTLCGAAHPATGAALADVLDFTAIDRGEAGERVLKAYAELKKKAENSGSGIASMLPGESGFIGLPAWPGYPPSE